MLRRSVRMNWRTHKIIGWGSYQSGQMGLTVNQLRELRRFESSTAHQDLTPFLTCPCGAAVAHSLGKTGVMGSIPITGSCSSLQRCLACASLPGKKHCDVVFFFQSRCPNAQAVGCREVHRSGKRATSRRRLLKVLPIKQLEKSSRAGKVHWGWLLHV